MRKTVVGKIEQLTTCPAVGASELKAMLDAIKAIRASDCGAWQKDCMGGLFSCRDGRDKRMELGRLLDRLYKAAGI